MVPSLELEETSSKEAVGPALVKTRDLRRSVMWVSKL